MARLDTWSVEFRPGGWIRARSDGGLKVFFQVAPVGDSGASSLRIHAALMASEQPITAHTWRTVPYDEIEMHSQLPGVREVLEQAAEVDQLGAAGLDQYFDQTTERHRLSGVIPTERVLIDEVGPLELSRPSSGRITDEFLAEVAVAYSTAVRAGLRPAPALADVAGVPVRTVHRWIAEARKRGALPPGVRGKAG